MSLRESGRIKLIVANSGGTLTPSDSESFRITNIFCVPSTNDTYLTLINGQTNIGKVRVKGKTGNHLAYPSNVITAEADFAPGTIFDLARAAGAPIDIPVPAGTTFAVTRYAEAGNVCLVYDVFDAGDVKADEINGPRANILRYVHYGQNTLACLVSPVAISTSLIWSNGPQWPFNGLAVPDGQTFRVLALLASPVSFGNGVATNLGYTTALQMLLNSTYLFDSDRVGLPLLGDVAQVAAAALYKSKGSVLGMQTAEYPHPARVLPSPIVAPNGTTLGVNIVVAGISGAGISAALADVALLMEQTLGS